MSGQLNQQMRAHGRTEADGDRLTSTRNDAGTWVRFFPVLWTDRLTPKAAFVKLASLRICCVSDGSSAFCGDSESTFQVR